MRLHRFFYKKYITQTWAWIKLELGMFETDIVWDYVFEIFFSQDTE